MLEVYMSKIYYDANQIAEMLDVSKASAYNIIKKLNTELEERGFIVISGKISKVYFNEKWYGGTPNITESDVLQGVS